MFWQEDAPKAHNESQASADLTFKIACPRLPIDHAWALMQAVRAALPWLADEPRAALHLVHGAASGNGWSRPPDKDGILQLSRRARFGLRLPRARLDDARRLEGAELDVCGCKLTLGAAGVRPLRFHATLFSRHLPLPPRAGANGGEGAAEAAFLQAAAERLAQHNITAPRMIAGQSHALATPDGTLATRSLMIDGLRPEESLRLQERGLGDRQQLGCGVFIPHKGIGAVYEAGE